jgi:hypothetical protein
MIRELRVWHRRWFVLLAIALPLLLLLALRDRPRVPRVEALPSGASATAEPTQDGVQ